MNPVIIKQIKETTNISEKQIQTVLNLLDEGNTIPFISRYRKEVTGGLDEEQIFSIHQTWSYQKNLFERKEDVIRLIDEKGMLTDDLKQSILKAEKLVDVEDFYRPFKEKKKTKATEAIAKGLQGLSNFFMYLSEDDPKEEAKKYVNDDVKTVEEALEGAMHILSEFVSDDPDYRKALRETMRDGEIKSSVKKGIDDERQTYLMYYEYQEKIKHIKPHRVLALNRGESEKILTVKIEADKDAMSKHIETSLIRNTDSPSAAYIKLAIDDGIKRLIYPSLEREVRSELSEVAEDQAIEVFAENLNKLLLQPPLSYLLSIKRAMF